MIYIGIDPGLDGALAAIDADGKAVSVHDAPTSRDGGKRRYLLADMAGILRGFPEIVGARMRACVERVHSMPKQGVASSFGFGEGFGLWQGLLAGLGIPFDLATPQAWKKSMLAGAGKEKDAARIRAQQLFPGVELHLKKHHGRAEALLIAEYRRRIG